jgi:CDP-6-deoxy-D-xylo-4-hexulose-3-dehydrase
MEGALETEQLKKLPALITNRRHNGAFPQEEMSNHPALMIQREMGMSSWFGFSMVIRRGWR